MVKIEINTVEKPIKKHENDILRWFCLELGLTTKDDEEGIEIAILKNFIIAAYKNKGITSLKLKDMLNYPLARSTVIYHLNRLINAGLIVKKGRYYFLRGTVMSRTIEELEYDLNKEFRRMIETAEQLDKLMIKKLKTKN
jgi:predicted transcriptional regulator